MKTNWMFGCAMLLMACGGGSSLEPSSSEVTGGKADSTDQSGAVEYVCSYDIPFPANHSNDLAELATGSTHYMTSDTNEIGDLVAERQIITAVARLAHSDDTIDEIAEAFDNVDGGEISRHELDLGEGDRAEWIEFALGDTEVGVVFDGGTLNPIAEIGDGDVYGCGPTEPLPESEELTCDWDIAFAGGIESSRELADFTTKNETVTVDDIDNLTELQSRQIFKAVKHTSTIVGDEDFDVVFDVVDEGSFELVEVSVNGDQFDWVVYYAGDTEVGVVFDDGTLDIVAEVGDGDILGCEGRASEEPPAPTESPEPTARYTCHWDNDFPVATSSDLRAFTVGERVTYSVDNVDELDEQTAEQIFLATVLLEFGTEGHDFDVVFDVADEGLFYVQSVEIGADVYDWIRFYAGDTEVGIVFQAGTTIPAAEIGDGDIMGCVVSSQ